MSDITIIALQNFVITTSELTSTNFLLADKKNEIDDSYNISMFTVAPNNDVTIELYVIEFNGRHDLLAVNCLLPLCYE